jgi:hypothetical protein
VVYKTELSQNHLGASITCLTGYNCEASALPVAQGGLVRDCCPTTTTPGASPCAFRTGCIEHDMTLTSNPNILTWYGYLSEVEQRLP